MIEHGKNVIPALDEVEMGDATKSKPSSLGYLGHNYNDTELIFGIVNPVGVEYKKVVDILKERLVTYGYQCEIITVSSDVISKFSEPVSTDCEFRRITAYMDAGNSIRQNFGDNSILALGVAAEINNKREWDGNQTVPRQSVAYIINSLKHPEEVDRLREIYSSGFYLVGIASDEERKLTYLKKDKRCSEKEAKALLDRDSGEFEKHGQQTRDTFQHSDFFVHIDGHHDKLKYSLWRILDLVFGKPHLTPTFDEYAMFMAFTTALRSADLSRQIGAVIAKNDEIISTGTNDCPKAGGGLYWPYYDDDRKEIVDAEMGRDYVRGYDSNKREQSEIINNILRKLDPDVDKEKVRAALQKSRIKDITEYGRVVHAEMEALLCCARNNVSTRGAALYCTTYPCHNCAKHIIAAGIEKVVYIEPYPKSKALEFHPDAITHDTNAGDGYVQFIPFIGVGPRRYFDLFSMNIGNGSKIKRKRKDGVAIEWTPEKSRARVQMLPFSYMEKEIMATVTFEEYMEGNND